MVEKNRISWLILVPALVFESSCMGTKNIHKDVITGKDLPKQSSTSAIDQNKAGASSNTNETSGSLISKAPLDTPQSVVDTAVDTTTRSGGTPPRIGLIFSGGGAKTWAHIGVLKELEQFKWPISAVGGQEWGAVVAALYAYKLSANEVEWELSKIKSFDGIDEISNLIFGNRSVADLKVPFVCPSLNINKQNIYFLNRGQLNKLVPFCIAHPPIFKPYQQSIADLVDFTSLANHLRATGANRIVLINVLSQNVKRSMTADYLSSENILWVQSAAVMNKKIVGIDEIINIDLDDYGITNIDKRREIIAKGSELSYKVLKAVSKRLGL